jgi:hypothetical protein
MNVRKNIKGQRFGRLVAIEPKIIKGKRTNWLCKCDCGNEHTANISRLIRGETKSCGCLRKEISTKNGIKYQSNLKPLDIEKVMMSVKKTCVEGTSLNCITETIPSHNTSGVKGVTYDKSRHKWQATIEFQRKRYYLGRFDRKEDAIKARKKAEEQYFQPIKEKYGVTG